VVPVLVDNDGWALVENVAILNYLADRYPEVGLGGDGSARGRAEVNRWLGFLNSDVHPAFKPLFAPQRYIADVSQHAALQDKARQTLRGYFESIGKQLTGRDWLTGRRSLADPYLFVVVRWARAKHVDLHGLDALERFLAHMHEDPGVAAAMKAEGF
jgi:glutathione S-transferase